MTEYTVCFCSLSNLLPGSAQCAPVSPEEPASTGDRGLWGQLPSGGDLHLPHHSHGAACKIVDAGAYRGVIAHLA